MNDSDNGYSNLNILNLHLTSLPDSGDAFPFKLFLAMKGPHMDIDKVLAAKQCSYDSLANLVLGTWHVYFFGEIISMH